MTLDWLTNLFGWMTIINIGLLLFSTLILTVCKSTVIRIHQKLTGLDADKLKPVYLQFLTAYKMLIIVFNLVPYLALKII